ncbi:histidine kinase [candidate division KSB1 bacterium]
MKLTSLKIFFLIILFFSSALSQHAVISISRNLHKHILFREVSVLEKNIERLEDIDVSSDEWYTIQLGRNERPFINSFKGTNWLQAEILITDTLSFRQELTLNLINIGAVNEVYWDKHLIAGKGISRESIEETSGSANQLIRIPYDYTLPGNHRLLIKIRNEDPQSLSKESGILIGFYEFFLESRIEHEVEQKYTQVFFMAILFAAAVFSLILFFGFNRNVEYLFFSLFCLASSRKAYYIPIPMLERSFEAAISFSDNNLSFILYIITNLALLAFLITRFSFHKTHKTISIFLLLSPLIIIAVPEIAFSERIHYYLMTVLPVGIAFYAACLRKENSLLILFGLTGANILIYLGNYGLLWNGYFLGIVFFIISISILSSREIAGQYRKHREAVLMTARLELELLKRNIQPHFILNTLTSLQEIVEQNPQKASKLIQALGEEFQMFSKVSGKKLISISDELKICLAHLKIMEYRKGVNFKLHTEGIDGDEKVPPGIFHTLIENGTTHGYTSKSSGTFRITKESNTKLSRYVIFNDSENVEKQVEIKKGTGMQYIEARLEESFPGSWKLSGGQTEKGWEVVIDISEKKEDIS